MTPKKTDATTICAKCSGIMTISMIEPLPMEPDFMQHTFVCALMLRNSNSKRADG